MIINVITIKQIKNVKHNMNLFIIKLIDLNTIKISYKITNVNQKASNKKNQNHLFLYLKKLFIQKILIQIILPNSFDRIVKDHNYQQGEI